MDLVLSKNFSVRNTLARLLSFLVLIFAVRFAYFIAVKGRSCVSNDFCFFPSQNFELTVHPSAASTSRSTVDHYSSVFQDLIADGYLSPSSKSLCIETLTGEEVIALKEIGVMDSTGISKKSKKLKRSSPPLIILNNKNSYPFDDNTFDFQFTNNLDGSGQPAEFGSEICRTLKPGRFVVIHTKARDSYSLESLLDLFSCCRLIKSREINGVDSVLIVREIVLMKVGENAKFSGTDNSSISNCYGSGLKREIVKNAEPLIVIEPLRPWIALKKNLKNIRYLSSTVDISFKRKYVYVDVGARSYGSSIGSWFKKIYPKQNKSFEIYAIEADKVFCEGYRAKKGVTLLPNAAWVRNETLFFGISRDVNKKFGERGRGMGRVQTVQSSMNYMGNLDKIEGFDFAGWLKNLVRERDFVVVKMDVEGTEFHLIPRLIETGAICLIDELFLECHYNRWQRCCPGQRSVKFQKTYDQCLELFTSLRNSGVLVHQWW